nr:V-type ATP synthase subunit B [Candidatus Delongbacteria bacterium]
MKLVHKEYLGISRADGPIIIIENTDMIGYNELVEITDQHGRVRHGTVLEVAENYAAIQVFEGTYGLSQRDTRVKFLGHTMSIGVSPNMLGRIFNGTGVPIDGHPAPASEKSIDVNGMSINPVCREYPVNFIQTGISGIDGLNTLVRGQKLPIFTGAGLPHNEIATQIVKNAQIGTGENFIIVFAAMGVKHDDADFFMKEFHQAGAFNRVILFLNLADDPTIERLFTPRAALTVAEYYAFELNYHVLVIMTDMTNYCEALREIATAREEIPSRKGYPGYMYSDLASLYERTGRIKGKNGSITQIPILSMPNDDITHPIPDLTGYITEGQIVLSRELHAKNIFPPIEELPSLSRLMKDCIGGEMTRADHPNLASQLYAAYANVQSVRALASVIGEEELSETDKKYLK